GDENKGGQGASLEGAQAGHGHLHGGGIRPHLAGRHQEEKAGRARPVQAGVETACCSRLITVNSSCPGRRTPSRTIASARFCGCCSSSWSCSAFSSRFCRGRNIRS